jgi:apurinic endonuclease APN1
MKYNQNNQKKLNIGISITLPINWNYTGTGIDETDYTQIAKTPIIKNFNSLQIMFSKTNLTKQDVSSIKKFVKKIKYNFVFIHASYQINIGTEPILTKENLYSPGLEIFLSEIKYAIEIGANGIIVHMGKNVKQQYDPDNVYNNMVNFVIQLFAKIEKYNLLKKSTDFTILFETPAGQGGEMCTSIDSFVNFIQLFKKTKFYNRIGICIDTCHIFQAGHNLNDKTVINKIHKILQPVEEKIKVIHLNDSYHSVGKNIDRHEQIGKGHILTDNLIKFILPYVHLPLILETKPPYDKQYELIKI